MNARIEPCACVKLTPLDKAKGELRRGTKQEPRGPGATLAELGIDKKTSSVARQLAKLPAKELKTIATGKTTLSKVLHEVKRTVRRKKVEEQSRVAALDAVIVQSDWRSWLEAQGSCDLLLTDPPYSTDVADIRTFAHDWLPAALAKVKPSGRLMSASAPIPMNWPRISRHHEPV